MSLTSIVNMVGIELEGGWDKGVNCSHYCDEDCQDLVCSHDCDEDIDCWQLNCNVDIDNCTCDPEEAGICEACEHKKIHESETPWLQYWSANCAYRNRLCWVRSCSHEDQDECFVDNCRHDCYDDDECNAPDVQGWHEDVSVNVSDYVSGEVASPPFNTKIASLVEQVTDVTTLSDGNRKTRKLIEKDHISKATFWGKSIKLADLLDNSQDILTNDPGFAKLYLREKRDLLEVLSDGHPILFKRASDFVKDYEK